MFSLKGLTKHCLLAIIDLIPIGNLCIVGIQYNFVKAFIFSGIDIEKYCLISLTVKLTVELIVFTIITY